ncbi:hypothetical protein [uncultured Methanomethylovorans sp.]|uniref:hypothetical protein n=1 Tax=uncultured Methanomethylovorans sp. TaxID=183759 RepID=UPI002AA6DAFA|nr:hypothetical protein [uncultured Methanomethylovorans sp.]
MQVDGNKNVVANAGGIAKHITKININGMSEEQFKMISAQLSKVLSAIRVKDMIGDKSEGVTPEQQVIVREVEKKVKDADSLYNETIGTPETYLPLGDFEYECGNFEKALNYYK